jgi:hypothetical protein
MSNKKKPWYILIISGVLFILTNADKPEFGKNECEKLALLKIANSNEKVVFINDNCTVLSWEKITDSTKSKLNGELLKKWRVTNELKLYYQNK